MSRVGPAALPAELREVWAAGRVAAVHAAPYLATALLALQPRVVGPAEPAALAGFPVDGRWRVRVDPRGLAQTPPRLLAFWLVHQVGHLLRQHADRFAALGEPADGPLPAGRRWGIATDYEVNDDVPEELRPAAALLPQDVGLTPGGTAEQYWAALGAVPPAALAGAHPCGSVDEDPAAGGGADEPGLGADESRLLREETARQVAAQARAGGAVPEAWQRWAAELLEPVVDWRRELAAALRRGVATVAGRVDHTYRRPSRRASAVPGVILAALVQPSPGVCVVLDTSRSMAAPELGRAVAEVAGIVRALGVGRRSLRVLCCDTTAREPARVFDAREIRLVGGGGTDLRAGLEAAAQLRPRPDLVVVLTDGETDWPPGPPRGATVVVGLLDEPSATGALPPPPWARTVRIPVERS
ncbi:MAG: hypothetical protein JWM67_2102 [Mycobacterium sp.]|nr:hypothetical protein [Mycobacterium sp.]